jgi:hypothetical protein
MGEIDHHNIYSPRLYVIRKRTIAWYKNCEVDVSPEEYTLIIGEDARGYVPACIRIW